MLTQRQGPDLPLGVAPQAGQVRTETWECPPGPQPTRSPSAAPVVPAPTLPAPAPPPGLTGNPSPAPTQAPLLPVLEPAGSLTRRTGLRLPPVGSSSGASLRYTSSKAKPCTSCRPPTGPPQGPPPAASPGPQASPAPGGRFPPSGSLSVSSRLRFRPPAFTQRAQAPSSFGMNTFAARWWCPPCGLLTLHSPRPALVPREEPAGLSSGMGPAPTLPARNWGQQPQGWRPGRTRRPSPQWEPRWSPRGHTEGGPGRGRGLWWWWGWSLSWSGSPPGRSVAGLARRPEDLTHFRPSWGRGGAGLGQR